MAERTLTQRDLNRALLARQLLLERVRLPLPRALERIGGIQNQYAPNAYIRLFSCLEGFQRDDLTHALERRAVVNATLMRATIHMVSSRDFWPFTVATRPSQRGWWLRVRRPRPKERELEATAKELVSLMAGGPRRHEELARVVGRGWGMVGPWLELVRVPPSGTWEQRRAHLFQTAERWLGPENVDFDDALDHLVRRYLAAFGPASPSDLAGWAGMKTRDVAPALERLRLRRFRDERGKELLDLQRAPLPSPETAAPVRFLPTWDAVLLVHARRTGVLPEEYRPLVFSTKTPHSVGTFLVDGSVAGTWRYERGKVTTSEFGRLDRAARSEVREEADRLAEFHA
ncbi:MAG: winged helix DNA-binding domain-containing protein [Actinobacteria bacterium]|nr:winged helix DNA-binding domain-containing protein [Actinomycetota bacterium]